MSLNTENGSLTVTSKGGLNNYVSLLGGAVENNLLWIRES
jgi:hypothetical protein